MSTPALRSSQPLLLRRLEVADLSLLARWLAAPHVRRWWHEDPDPAAVRGKYLPCLDGRDPTVLLIAELAAGPVGFVQHYRWSDNAEHARTLGALPDEAGFDYLLGDPGHYGHGLGTRLVAATIERIRADPTIAGVVVDPEAANAASCRVLEKNGLRLAFHAQLDDPDGRPIGPTAVYRRRFGADESQ